MISSGHNSSNLVWLRLDLRHIDNPALCDGGEVIHRPPAGLFLRAHRQPMNNFR